MMTSSVHQQKAASSSQCLVYYIQCLVYNSLVNYKSLVYYIHTMPGLLHTQCLVYYRVWSTTSLVYYIHAMPGLLHMQCLVYYTIWPTTQKICTESGLLQTYNAWSTTFAVSGLLQSLVNYSYTDSGLLHIHTESGLLCIQSGLLHIHSVVCYNLHTCIIQSLQADNNGFLQSQGNKLKGHIIQSLQTDL